MAGFEAMARTNMEWFQNAMRMFSPHVAAQKAAEAAKSPDSAKEEIEALKKRLTDMQQQLDRIAKSG
jgi:polyhydroxyalkanoate synthesis regulator protein